MRWRQLPGQLREASGQASVRELIRCSVHHFLNDGYNWSIFPLLPFIAAEFGLSYGGTGAIKTVFNALLSATGVPYGILAERIGEVIVLTGGTVLFAVGIACLSLAPSYSVFLGTAFVAGAGAGASHPVGSSLVSKTAPRGRMSTYIGALNFSGDVGKALLPIAAGALGAVFGWRVALLVLGVAGAILAFSLSRWKTLDSGDAENGDAKEAQEDAHEQEAEAEADGRENGDEDATWGVTNWLQFSVLNGIGILDSLPRSGVIAFSSFILMDVGFSSAAVGAMLSLVAAGGALGKLVCGPLADRLGRRNAIIVTEILTAATIVAFVRGDGLLIYPVLFLLGLFLNGTSSVLYAVVPQSTTEAGRSRGFGMYYTTTLAASGIAPMVYGFIGDIIGLYSMYHLMAAVLLLTVPLSFFLRSR